jgi:hypothetical protein
MFQYKDLTVRLAYPREEGKLYMSDTPCDGSQCGALREVADGDCECTKVSFGDTTGQRKSTSSLPLLRQQMRRGLEQARL